MDTSKCPKCGTKQEYHGTCRVNSDGSEVKMTVWHCGSRQIVEVTGEVDWRDGAECKGLAFKAYTHERMDKLGAPHTVEESAHTKAGCRIGGRFDWVEAELARLKSEKEAAEETFTDPEGEVWTRPTAEAYYRACQALKKRSEKLGRVVKKWDAATSRAEALATGIESIHSGRIVLSQADNGEWGAVLGTMIVTGCETAAEAVLAALLPQAKEVEGGN